MAVTDQTILSQIQRVTIENTGDSGTLWPSGQWTLAEVLGYLNQRQNRFLAETGLIWTRAETNITISQSNQANPSDWIATVFLAYKTAAGLYRELPKLDTLELDYVLSTWPGSTSASPRGYYETDGATLTTFVVPIPTEAGSALERYYVAMGTPFTQTPAVNFSVPDEFVPTIKAGALADMFGKIGEGQTLVLAQLFEERWEEGLEMGRLIAGEGWFAR
jgi:hypothetical protein